MDELMPIPDYTALEYLRAVGYILKRQRIKAGVTQEEAAATVGMDRSHLANWEAGEHEPGIYRLMRLLAYYGCESGECFRMIHERALVNHRRAKSDKS